jgi:hypothetical protein
MPIYREDHERTALLEAANRIAGKLRSDGQSGNVNNREDVNPGAKHHHCYVSSASKCEFIHF